MSSGAKKRDRLPDHLGYVSKFSHDAKFAEEGSMAISIMLPSQAGTPQQKKLEERQRFFLTK
jgi:hypothetical protein